MSAHQTRSQRRESKRRHVLLGEGQDLEWDAECRWIIACGRAMESAWQLGIALGAGPGPTGGRR